MGILSSYIFWWYLTHYLKPEIDFSPKISKLVDPYYKSGYKYRIKMKNTGRRDIIDVQVVCRFYAGNVLYNTPDTVSIIKLKITSNYFPYVNSKGKDKIIRIFPERSEVFQKQYYPDNIRLKSRENTLLLEDILSMKKSYIEFSIFAFDRYSGSRKLFVSHKYVLKDIMDGVFKKGKFDIIKNIDSSKSL